MKNSKKILIIDDDPDMRKALKGILTILGHKSFFASNGVRALEILSQKDKPAMIFCDLMMPKMNGFEFLETLKSDKSNSLSSIPVVILSSEKNLKSKLAKFGVDFLNKSYNISDLVRLIRRYCEG